MLKFIVLFPIFRGQKTSSPKRKDTKGIIEEKPVKKARERNSVWDHEWEYLDGNEDEGEVLLKTSDSKLGTTKRQGQEHPREKEVWSYSDVVEGGCYGYTGRKL